MPFYIFNAIYVALDSFVLLRLLAALAALNNFLSFLNILPLLWIHSFQLCWAFHAFNYFSVATCSFTLPLSPLLPACKLTFQKTKVWKEVESTKKTAKKLATGLVQVDSTCPSVKKVASFLLYSTLSST
jgi:hypothetical protein